MPGRRSPENICKDDFILSNSIQYIATIWLVTHPGQKINPKLHAILRETILTGG
jgi:hypothetical protein